MRPDPLRDQHPVSDKRRTRFSASFLRGFRLLPKGLFPTAKLHGTGAQSIANNVQIIVTLGAVTWDRVADDAAGHADFLMAEVASNRLKVRIPGIYNVTGAARWASNATGRRALLIRVNTADTIIVTQPATPGVNTTDQVVTGLFELLKDDTIQLMVIQDSGAALNLLVSAPWRPSLSAVWVAM